LIHFYKRFLDGNLIVGMGSVELNFENTLDGVENMDISDPESEMRLDNLPLEILLHILQYLDVKFIVEVLSEVSSQFLSISRDQSNWRIRLSERWPGQYPAVPTRNLDWTQACIARETEQKLWQSPDTNLQSVVCSNAHYSSVDCVKIIGDLVVSGSRDRGINIWNIDDVVQGVSKPRFKFPDAHKGWVWSFSSSNWNSRTDYEKLVSGSWDNTVKFWSITSHSLQETRKPINLKVAVLSTDMLSNTVVAGTFDKKVILMDAREDVKKLTFYRSHSKPVLAVKVTERQVLSLSEDQTLVVYDRVAGRKFKRINIPGDGFPLSLSLHNNSLYVGDKSGGVHLLDAGEDRYSLVSSYYSDRSGKVSSISANLGSVLTSASDGTIRAFQPDRKMSLISAIKNPDCGELAQLCYEESSQTMAAAFSNNTVKIWTRRN